MGRPHCPPPPLHSQSCPPPHTDTMKVLSFLLATCIAVSAAHLQKRQDAPMSPPPPPNPPADPVTNVITDAVDANPTGLATMLPAGNAVWLNATMMPVAPANDNDTTTDAPAPAANATDAAPAANTMAPTDAPTTMPPATTEKPAPPTTTKLVTVEEIVDVFDAVSQTRYFKKLPFEDQLLVMELLSGGEAGKISPILEQIGYKHLLRFMYDIPLKYVDNFYAFIEQWWIREDMAKASGYQGSA